MCVHDLLQWSSLANCSALPVLEVINKDCTNAVCLYSSQCECLLKILSCRAEKLLK